MAPRELLFAGTIAPVGERGVAGTGITEPLARSGTVRRSTQNFHRGKEQLRGIDPGDRQIDEFADRQFH